MGNPGTIDDIKPFAELAQNATTLVYKAYQKSLERFVLLKRLRPEFSSDEDLARRFQDEARIVARVQHPNVVAVYSYGRDEEGAYMVAEFIEGCNLHELIGRDRIPPEIAVYILLESARGLKAAHEKEVLHRDLKPANILLSHDGEVKLADFGLASVIGASGADALEIRGTLAYLAPEQILGKPVNERSDLFSLGVTFYEMLTGRRAFPGSTSSEIFDSILNREPLHYLPATPGVDDGIAAISARLLAREPDERYPDSEALIADLETWLAGLPVGRKELADFLANPASYEAVVRPHTKNGRIEAPEVRIVADSPRPTPFWRRASVAAGVLLFAVALVYAGVSMWGGRADEPLSAPDLAIADIDGESTGTPGASASTGADSLREAMGLSSLSDSEAADDELSVDDAGRRGPEAGLPSRTGSEPQGGADARTEPQGGTDSQREADSRARPVSGEGVNSETNASDSQANSGSTADAADREKEAAPGNLRISVDPAATVFIGEQSVGSATPSRPLILELEAGSHQLTLKYPGFPAHVTEVSIASGETTPMDVSLWSTVGLLHLKVSPWAHVYIDGRYVGETPISSPLILLPGVHKLRLVHDDLGEHTTDFTIVAGDTLRRTFNLFEL